MVGTLGVLAVVAAVAYGVQRGIDGLHDFVAPHVGPTCSATVEGREVVLTHEQAQNASLIAAIGVGRGLPARAVTIALATAYQESDLVNLEYGDRDSLGLFQQRPSQGWGTRAEVLDPVHASSAFYDALVRIPGYESMEITEAAQLVQRSAFPGAYADHEPDARVLASALTGYSEHAFACEPDGDPSAAPGGAADRASALAAEMRSLYGGSVRADGDRVRVSVADGEAGSLRGWALAQYVVAQQARFGVARVAFDGRVWTAQEPTWQANGAGQGTVVIGVA